MKNKLSILYIIFIPLLLSFTFIKISPSEAFTIVEPTPDTALTSGQTVTARVNLGNDVGIVEVRYYWYGERDEVLVSQKDDTALGAIIKSAALVSQASHQPPFGGTLHIPNNAIGIMRLLAVAEISRGRLHSRTVFDEIEIEVKPDAKLLAIDFDGDKPLKFGSAGREAVYATIHSLGEVAPIPTVGHYSDGVTRSIQLPSTGTTYTSSDPSIVKVFPEGVLQLMGNGRATITASNGEIEGQLDVHIQVPEEPNEPPEAEAGPNRTVKSGSRVILDGLESFDPEGGGLRYHWSQIRGVKIPLLDLNMPKASFQAPNVSEPKRLRFQLRVTDKKEADSFPDHVDIMVEP